MSPPAGAERSRRPALVTGAVVALVGLWSVGAQAAPATGEPPRPALLEMRVAEVGTKAAPAPAGAKGLSPPMARKIYLPRPSAWDMVSGWYLNRNFAIARHLDYTRDSRWKKVGRFGYNLGLFLAGIVASTVWHELGHFFVAKALGVPFKWPASGWDGVFVPLWSIPTETSPNKRIAVGVSGFAASAIATEVILWVPYIPKDNVFVLGFLAHSIINNLFYSLTDLIRGGYGDIDAVRKAGASVVGVHVPLVLHSLLAIARLVFLHTKFGDRFSPWARRRASGTNIVLWQW